MQQIADKFDTVRKHLMAMEETQETESKFYGALDKNLKANAEQRLPATEPMLYSRRGDAGAYSSSYET
ncbi:MAG: hypothetical protein KGP14_10600 [Betaproteobacteria bacterium]|nr:hypothetical protein [Betaproteobacteria bacterium]